jgi:hypothetical protein
MDKDVTQIIKKPKRETVLSIPDGADGDNSKYTKFALAIMQLPKLDITVPEQLSARLNDYFALCAEHDMKPGVAALALALGMDRRRLWEINNDVAGRNLSIPEECKSVIKMAYNSLEVLWESYSTSGKINPVTAIFLGKNNFGYADKQEYVVTPNTLPQNASPDIIEAKYAELPDMDGETE